MRLLRHLALLTLIFALAACADKPTEPELTEEDIARIVADKRKE